jgi:cold shock CspA family protein
MRGTVVSFFPEKGFGFVRWPGNFRRDAFFHIREFRTGADANAVGTVVNFELQEGPRGLRAVDVEVVD